MIDELERIVWRLSLKNALLHGGRAKKEAVLGKVFSERPDLKSDIQSVILTANSVVKQVNQLSTIKQRRMVEEKWPEILQEEGGEVEEKGLPPLPRAEKYPLIHLRFCPNPDGALHLGGCRAAVLDHEYAKTYQGRLTLRFDDTDPRTKSPIPDAYQWIREDLEWLGVEWHSEVYQSDRIEIYYSYTERLLSSSSAYVCTCKPNRFRELVSASDECPCRGLSVDEQLDRWKRMLRGGYREGEAVVRIKTDLKNPNPAVREWPALRIIDVERYPHPRVGDKYRVWPLFAFCCAIDDHDLGVSHILRGKEHLTNSERARFLYQYLGWSGPEAIHYGRMKIMDSVLSKSKIRKGIVGGVYTGWDDPRLGTLKALRRRGFLPETIRQLIMDLGPKPVDVRISWSNLEALNRKLIDPLANRFFFVPDCREMTVRGVDRTYISKLNLHPDYPERGQRVLKVTPRDGVAHLLVSGNDLQLLEENPVVRLMGLFNIRVDRLRDRIEACYSSEAYLDAKEKGAPLIHWIPESSGVETLLYMPDNTVVEGLAEEVCKDLERGQIIQFERIGFARVSWVNRRLEAYFAHR